MMSTTPPRSPRRRVHAHLREIVAIGTYRPGDAISIIGVAASLALSTTPVREGLSRLVGEGLVEDRDRDGFRMTYLSSRDIADCYQLEADLLVAAITACRAAGTRAAAWATALPAPAEGIATPPMAFVTLRDRCGSEPLRQSLLNIADRLAPYRLQEADALSGVAEELAALEQLVRMQGWQELQTAVRRYAKRRVRIAPELHDRSGALRVKRG
jgi:signal transduction histidine kinase